jgi:hypothetical protein
MNPMALAHVIKSDKDNHGAEFTVRSRKTGNDFTFKLATKEYQGKHYTHVKVETEYLKFKYLGFYSKGVIVRKHEEVKSPSALAIAWVLRKVEHQQEKDLNDNVEVFHLGQCIRCGRTLTDATSIEIGLGPICRGGHES